MSRIELAYRWIRFHSALRFEHGDAIVSGTSNIYQLEKTLNFFNKGPLSSQASQLIEETWESIKDDAGTDNFAALSGN